jgi:hypothetical protein
MAKSLKDLIEFYINMRQTQLSELQEILKVVPKEAGE